MIELDYRSKKPIYEQIIESIKLQILQGYLKPGDAIPSVRGMAKDLGVTPSTVAKAYQEMERQQVIETIRAKGTFIAAQPVTETLPLDREKIRCNLRSELIELKRAKVSKEMVLQMIGEIYDAI
ncbi:MAG: GntR family transcriptional regulator [Lachnospiraceae bacterium]|nr:GntR family transcriptional regulator [Lachnospiraceae bacterium]